MFVLTSIPRQEPYDLGTDDLGRRQFSINVDVLHARESDSSLNPMLYAALGEYLRDTLSLAAGTTYLLGDGADLPKGVDGPGIRVIGRGGGPAVSTFSDLIALPRDSVQILVFGRDEVATAKFAYRVYVACAFSNTTVTAREEP